LAFAANVAKFIWPSQKALRPNEIAPAMKRGRRIRNLLGIKKQDRTILQSPVVRHHFEHLDLRVDRWAKGTTGASIAVHALAGEKSLEAISERDRFTRYDPSRDVLSVLDDKINLTRLEASVKAVWSRSSWVYRHIVRDEARLESQQAPNPRR
jgi:hypothetical protein